MLALVLAFVIGTFGFNYQVTIALMSREVFDLGAEAFGLLSTCFAVGSLSGALLSTRRSVRPRQRFLVVSMVVFGLFTIVAGLMPGSVWFADAGAHGAAAWFQRGQQQLRPARRRPADARPRLALYFMCFWRHPVGAPLIGLISEHFGAPWGLILAARSSSRRRRRVVLAAVGGCGWWAGSLRPRLRLRIGERRTAVASARLRAAEEAAAERAPGRRISDPEPHSGIPFSRPSRPATGGGMATVVAPLHWGSVCSPSPARSDPRRPLAGREHPFRRRRPPAFAAPVVCGVRCRWSRPICGGCRGSSPSSPPGRLWSAGGRSGRPTTTCSMEAADALEVPQSGPRRPPDVARDFERLRLVAALEGAGLAVQV